MRRIIMTVFSILTMIVVFFIISQASNIGIPSEFNLVALVIVGITVIALIRTWLRP